MVCHPHSLHFHHMNCILETNTGGHSHQNLETETLGKVGKVWTMMIGEEIGTETIETATVAETVEREVVLLRETIGTTGDQEKAHESPETTEIFLETIVTETETEMRDLGTGTEDGTMIETEIETQKIEEDQDHLQG